MDINRAVKIDITSGALGSDLPTTNLLPHPEGIESRNLPIKGLFSLSLLELCDGRLHIAAKQLRISKGAFSRQISRLEKELGISLVERSQKDGRHLKLTGAGHQLVNDIRIAIPSLVNLSHSIQAAVDGASIPYGDTIADIA